MKKCYANVIFPYIWQCQFVGLLVHHFGPDWNISASTGWIIIKRNFISSRHQIQNPTVERGVNKTYYISSNLWFVDCWVAENDMNKLGHRVAECIKCIPYSCNALGLICLICSFHFTGKIEMLLKHSFGPWDSLLKILTKKCFLVVNYFTQNLLNN